MVLLGDSQRISLRLDDLKRDRKLALPVHSIPTLFPPNLDSGMILSANYMPFFLALLSYPLLGKVLSSYGSEPQRNVSSPKNWGQIFRRSVEVRTFVRTQKVICYHLLASKKEASFSFACGTPCGEWLSPCYVVCSVFFVSRAWQA